MEITLDRIITESSGPTAVTTEPPSLSNHQMEIPEPPNKVEMTTQDSENNEDSKDGRDN